MAPNCLAAAVCNGYMKMDTVLAQRSDKRNNFKLTGECRRILLIGEANSSASQASDGGKDKPSADFSAFDEFLNLLAKILSGTQTKSQNS
jgi:hypothetical protein